MTVVLISGSFSLSGQPRLRRLAWTLAAVAIFSHWLCNFASDPRLPMHLVLARLWLIWAYACTILFLVLIAGGVLFQLGLGRRVTSYHIQGAVAVYLLLGLIWGFGYALVELGQPGAFELPATPAGSGDMEVRQYDLRNLVYFSFVTLTTLGYGDISPASAGAQTLVTLEALAGQLYLVIMIARLVALQIAHSERES